MANKKLVARAEELGIENIQDLNDEELAERINEAQNADGVVNTTDTEDEGPIRRELTDKDRAKVYQKFNADGANVQAIADEYDISPEEVTAIVDQANENRVED